jgi:hypothetical protein
MINNSSRAPAKEVAEPESKLGLINLLKAIQILYHGSQIITQPFLALK